MKGHFAFQHLFGSRNSLNKTTDRFGSGVRSIGDCELAYVSGGSGDEDCVGSEHFPTHGRLGGAGGIDILRTGCTCSFVH